MFDNFERITRFIYRERKAYIKANHLSGHLDEEALACFFEGKLNPEARLEAEKHLLECKSCAEYLNMQFKIDPRLSKEVPDRLMEKIKKAVEGEMNIFEIMLKLKEKAWEIIQTSGDVLVGQELIPAPVLRSRQINKFKEELSIFKDLQEIRVLTKLEAKGSGIFDLTVNLNNKQGKGAGKGLRVTLIRGEIELESYICDTGNVVFENVPAGDYRIEITHEACLAAVINLKVKT